MNETSIEKLLAESIRATNRTTHAVRAFVLFLFIQLTFATLAFGLWQLALESVSAYECRQYGNCEPDAGWSIAVSLIAFAGVAISSVVGWNELGKSKVLDDTESNANAAIHTSASQPHVPENLPAARELRAELNLEERNLLLDDYVQDKVRFVSEYLSSEEAKLWASSGAPDLGSWILQGMPKLSTWLKQRAK